MHGGLLAIGGCRARAQLEDRGLELPVAASVSLSRRLTLISLTERHYQKGPIGAAPGSHCGTSVAPLRVLPLYYHSVGDDQRYKTLRKAHMYVRVRTDALV